MEAEFKNKIRTFEAVFDRKIRTSRLDFRKCSYKINGVYYASCECLILRQLVARSLLGTKMMCNFLKRLKKPEIGFAAHVMVCTIRKKIL